MSQCLSTNPAHAVTSFHLIFTQTSLQVISIEGSVGKIGSASIFVRYIDR